jgi:hypothetical protein
VSFWRYKLLEFVMMVLTFPLFVVSSFLVLALASQYLDFERSPYSFLAVAAPLLIVWLFVQYRLTKRAERWWLARHSK